MTQQVAIGDGGCAVGEIFGVDAVLARALVFEADTAEAIRDGHKEVVAVKVAGTEQKIGLGNQIAVQGQMLVGHSHHGFAIADDIQLNR